MFLKIRQKEALLSTKGDIAEADNTPLQVMIESGDRVLLVGEGRNFYQGWCRDSVHR